MEKTKIAAITHFGYGSIEIQIFDNMKEAKEYAVKEKLKHKSDNEYISLSGLYKVEFKEVPYISNSLESDNALELKKYSEEMGLHKHGGIGFKDINDLIESHKRQAYMLQCHQADSNKTRDEIYKELEIHYKNCMKDQILSAIESLQEIIKDN